jgi:hypothetical protein
LIPSASVQVVFVLGRFSSDSFAIWFIREYSCHQCIYPMFATQQISLLHDFY